MSEQLEDAFTPQPGEVEAFAWMHPQEIMSAYTQAPETWFAGTHHFPEDYACIRAVLAAAHHKGMIRPTHDIRRWHPLSKENKLNKNADF